MQIRQLGRYSMNFHKWIRKHFGRSIVKFLIGLLILAIIASAIIYLLTQFDYSHLLPSGTDTRSYVVNSGAPLTATPTPTAFARFPEADLTAAPSVPIATAAPTRDPNATPTPTPEPSPTPTPALATAMMAEEFRPGDRDDKYGNVGLSEFSYTGSIVTMEGWAYADVYGFDGRESEITLIVRLRGTNHYVAYPTVKEKNITGNQPTSDKAFNLDEAEFSVKFDVANVVTSTEDLGPLPDGTYIFGLSIDTEYNGEAVRAFYTLDAGYNMTVQDGEILSLLTPGTTAPPSPSPAPEASPEASASAQASPSASAAAE